MTNPSLKKNTIANYVGQFYLMAIGILVTPLYLKYLGAEAYGLVSFFSLLFIWLNLLDLGLTPTLSRQAAYARGHEYAFKNFKRILRSFEMIFCVLAASIVLILILLSKWISTAWLKLDNLEVSLVSYCIVIMAFIVGLRFFSGLYRSGLNGLEDQVWLNAINIIIASIKFLGALILLALISSDVSTFFEYQLFVGVLELVILGSRFYKHIPCDAPNIPLIFFDLKAVKSVAPFAVSIAYTASIWVFVSQVDKLVLSSVLPLSEFGYFSLVVLIASVISVVSSPISQAIQPRMTFLVSHGRDKEMLCLYSDATQLVTLLSMSVAIMIGLFSEHLIFAWTGDQKVAAWGNEILLWLALGNGVLAIIAFQYYLQVAYGKLKLHVKGATLTAIVDIPVVVYIALNYGALGVAIAWFVLRMMWGIIWVPIVHHNIVPGFHLKWLFRDVLVVVLSAGVMSYLVHGFVIDRLSDVRWVMLIQMMFAGLIVLVGSSFTCNGAYNFFKHKWIDRK